MKRPLFILVVMSLGAIASAGSTPVHVLIDFPDREDLDIVVAYEEVAELTGVKHPYMVKFWVLGAFAKAKVKYEIQKIDGEESVSSIQGLANDIGASWVYYVNGIRSPFHINTHSVPQTRVILFKYENK